MKAFLIFSMAFSFLSSVSLFFCSDYVFAQDALHQRMDEMRREQTARELHQVRSNSPVSGELTRIRATSPSEGAAHTKALRGRPGAKLDGDIHAAHRSKIADELSSIRKRRPVSGSPKSR